jgi:short-subunit dehydrogenase
MSFEGRRILLTGGAGGMGRLLAEGLVAEGAQLTIIDRVEEPPPCAGYIRADLATAEGLESAAGAVAGAACDTLINLAGIQHFGPFELQPPQHLLATYMVNLVAPARLIQAALPAMRARGAGHIVNVGSIFGSIAFAHFASYSSAKAGLKGLSQALRRELATTGIDVTYIAPRAVRTPLNSSAVLAFATATGMSMDEPGPVAARMLRAIRERRRDVYLGFPESLFVRINALAPGLVDRALAAGDRKAGALFLPH